VAAYLGARFGPLAIEPARVAEMLDQLGLRMVGAPRNLRLARRSSNAAVHTDCGPKVLKRYRPDWAPATVVHGHSILTRLEEARFPAVRLHRGPDGATWTAADDGVFAVFDWVPGTNYSINYLRRRDRLRLTRHAGALLARLHVTLEGFTPSGSHHLGFTALDGPRRRDVGWHAATLDDLRGRSRSLRDPEAATLAARLARESARVLDEIAALDASLSADELPRVVVHGDYGLHNLLFDRTGAVVVDFEVSRLDWRVDDLVSVLGKHRYRDGRYDFESIRCFVGAYEKVAPLAQQERDRFPEVWRLHKLRAAVQYWNGYFQTDGPVRKLASAVDAIGQADWAAGNPEPLVAIVGATRGRP
jgi:Ser/Thr protein kinase RdoA (MazF antagonist)